MPSANYDLSDDGILTVDWSFPAPVGPYEWSVGTGRDGVGIEDTGTEQVTVGQDATGVGTLDITEIVDPGETVELAVTTILFDDLNGGIHDQIQDTVEVSLPEDLSSLSISCQGINPDDPMPGDTITMSVDYSYTGPLSFPSVTFDVVLDGPTVTQTDTIERQIGTSGTTALSVDVPFAANEGDEMDVTVEATGIGA